MGDPCVVKLTEVLSVVRQYGSAVCMRVGQHFFVSDRQTRLTSFPDGQYVVSQTPQGLDGRVGEVFICVKAGQWLGFLVFTDLCSISSGWLAT